jgi:hypothetical protein
MIVRHATTPVRAAVGAVFAFVLATLALLLSG